MHFSVLFKNLRAAKKFSEAKLASDYLQNQSRGVWNSWLDAISISIKNVSDVIDMALESEDEDNLQHELAQQIYNLMLKKNGNSYALEKSVRAMKFFSMKANEKGSVADAVSALGGEYFDHRSVRQSSNTVVAVSDSSVVGVEGVSGVCILV